MTHQQLARLLGYDERTMRYWLPGDRGIPSAVAILVRLLVSGKISFRDVDKAGSVKVLMGLCRLRQQSRTIEFVEELMPMAMRERRAIRDEPRRSPASAGAHHQNERQMKTHFRL